MDKTKKAAKTAQGLEDYVRLIDAISDKFNLEFHDALALMKAYSLDSMENPVAEDYVPELIDALELDNVPVLPEADDEESPSPQYFMKIQKNLEIKIPSELVEMYADEEGWDLEVAMDDPYKVNQIVVFSKEAVKCNPDYAKECELQLDEGTTRNVWHFMNGACTVKLPACYDKKTFAGKLARVWYDDLSHVIRIDVNDIVMSNVQAQFKKD